MLSCFCQYNVTSSAVTNNTTVCVHNDPEGSELRFKSVPVQAADFTVLLEWDREVTLPRLAILVWPVQG